MALIKCPECGGEVSDKAGECPHCGFPIEEVRVNGEPEDKEFQQVTENKEDNIEYNNEEMAVDETLSTNTSVDEHLIDSTNTDKIETKKSMSKRNKIICRGVVGVIIVGGIVAFVVTFDMRSYSSAEKLLSEEKYEEASEIFKRLNAYKEADVEYNECRLGVADSLFSEKKYDDAVKTYDELNGF